MIIDADKFFPCSQAKFKKLLKVIELDWDRCDELKKELKVYFQERIPELPKEAEALEGEVAKYNSWAKISKAAAQKERKRVNNGGEPPYLEYKYVNEYESYKELARETEARRKSLLRSKAVFEKYIELL